MDGELMWQILSAFILALWMLASPAWAANTIWNSSDKDSKVTLGAWDAQTNLYTERSSGTANSYGMVRSNNSLHTGKVYFEITLTASSVTTSCGNCPLFGIANSTQSLTQFVGQTTNSFGVQSDGQAFLNNAQQLNASHRCGVSGGIAAPLGYTFGFAVDLTDNTIWCTTDGTNWSSTTSSNGDPVGNTGGVGISGINGTAVFIAWSGAFVGSARDGAILNVGNYGPFVFTLPSGYSGWDASGTTVSNGSGPGTWQTSTSAAYDSSGSSATLSGGNLTATGGGSTTTVDALGLATDAKRTGKLYYEVQITATTGGGLLSFGLANTIYAGTWTSSTYGSGVDPVGWTVAYKTNSNGYYKNSVSLSVTSHACNATAGTFVGVAVDFTDGKLFCTVDGSNWENGDNPATPTGGLTIPSMVTGYGAVPAVSLNETGIGIINYGAGTFHYNCPSGYTAWDGGTCANPHTASGWTLMK